MPSRLTQLLQLLEEAKMKGDTDQVGILEQELFTMKEKKQEGGGNRGGFVGADSGQRGPDSAGSRVFGETPGTDPEARELADF